VKKVYLVQLRDYDDTIPVAVYTEKEMAVQDAALRGGSALLDEIPIDPKLPPLLKWVVWPTDSESYTASWGTVYDNLGIHDWLRGEKCAIVEARCKEEAIELGKKLLTEAGERE